MPTFLVNRKMHPALRTRIERSVAGKTVVSQEERPAARALIRGLLITAVVSLTGFLWFSYQAEKRELEEARTKLLETIHGTRRAVSAEDLSLQDRITTLLARESGEYLGDLTPLPSNEWIEGKSSEIGVYIRLATGDARSPSDSAEKSLESSKDALLDCFLNPPESRDEKSLLARVRKVYGGSNHERSSVFPASSVFLSLVFLGPTFETQVSSATSKRSLEKLGASFSEAHLTRLTPSLKARYLVAALDEPKPLGTPSELDGAARHFVRLVVSDLRAARILFRIRKEVNPTWISEGARFRYALGLDGCRFGRDARLGEETRILAPK